MLLNSQPQDETISHNIKKNWKLETNSKTRPLERCTKVKTNLKRPGYTKVTS
jgi:hypothetical protein